MPQPIALISSLIDRDWTASTESLAAILFPFGVAGEARNTNTEMAASEVCEAMRELSETIMKLNELQKLLRPFAETSRRSPELSKTCAVWSKWFDLV